MHKTLLTALALLLLCAPVQAEQQVDVYLTSWCGYCRKLESFLKSKKIPYARHDIEKDEDAAAEFLRLGGEGVPLVRVGDEVVHGYDPEGILQALEP